MENFLPPSCYFSHDVESIRYLIKIGGITFLHSAETKTEAYMWLEMAKGLNGMLHENYIRRNVAGRKIGHEISYENQVNYFNLPVHEDQIHSWHL